MHNVVFLWANYLMVRCCPLSKGFHADFVQNLEALTLLCSCNGLFVTHSTFQNFTGALRLKGPT